MGAIIPCSWHLLKGATLHMGRPLQQNLPKAHARPLVSMPILSLQESFPRASCRQEWTTGTGPRGHVPGTAVASPCSNTHVARCHYRLGDSSWSESLCTRAHLLARWPIDEHHPVAHCGKRTSAAPTHKRPNIICNQQMKKTITSEGKRRSHV